MINLTRKQFHFISYFIMLSILLGTSSSFAQETSKRIKKQDNKKFLLVENVGIHLKEGDTSSIFYRSLDKYKKKKGYYTNVYTEETKIGTSIFEKDVIDTLKKDGFIDTVSRVFKNYSNVNYLDLDIVKLVRHKMNSYKYGGGGESAEKRIIELVLNWKVLDFYDKEVYKFTESRTSSGFLIVYSDSQKKIDEEEKKAIIEIIINSMQELMKQSEFEKIAELKSIDELKIIEREKDELLNVKSTKINESTKVSDWMKSAVTVKSKDGHGSGFFISSDGYIVSNYHVIAEHEKDLKIILNDGTETAAEVVRVSKANDLALLKIAGDNFTCFKLENLDIVEGTEVIAIGTPKDITLGQSVSKGIISGLRKSGGLKYIQTDVSVNSGNSGGALLTSEGLLAGVVTSKLFGVGTEGISFAIPSGVIFDALKIQQIK